jgi:hypothetical protein
MEANASGGRKSGAGNDAALAAVDVGGDAHAAQASAMAIAVADGRERTTGSLLRPQEKQERQRGSGQAPAHQPGGGSPFARLDRNRWPAAS